MYMYVHENDDTVSVFSAPLIAVARAAIVSHPFVGFSELGPALCRSDSSDDEKHRCAACRRKQCSNVYAVYLAGCKYDADGVSEKCHEKLYPW